VRWLNISSLTGYGTTATESSITSYQPDTKSNSNRLYNYPLSLYLAHSLTASSLSSRYNNTTWVALQGGPCGPWPTQNFGCICLRQ